MNTSFSTLLPGLQLAWDSVSRGALQTCARYYQLTIIQGHTTKIENIHFIFGIGIHGAQENYHREKAKGKSHKDALRTAVRYVLIYSWDFKRNRPWVSDEPTKTRETLIRTTIWYLEQFKEDVLKTVIQDNGDPGVELSFSFNSGLTSCTNEPFLFCGHIDRYVSWDKNFYITDLKTTKLSLTKDSQAFFDKYTLDDQMSGYYFAGKIIFPNPIKGLIIDAIQTAQNFSRFQRGETIRSTEQLEEWYSDTGYWFKQAERYAQDNYYPMNKKSCNNYSGCPFIPVCSEKPSLRDKILNDFYIRRVWDPLITREV